MRPEIPPRDDDMSSERLDIDQPIEREPGEQVVEHIIGWVAFAAFSPMIVMYSLAALIWDVVSFDRSAADEPCDDADKGEPETQGERHRRRVRMHATMLGISTACTAVIVILLWLFWMP